jgi:hypothetical protein
MSIEKVIYEKNKNMLVAKKTKHFYRYCGLQVVREKYHGLINVSNKLIMQEITCGRTQQLNKR